MPSFGETLRRERELRQISLREIAEATKINLRYLDALERNDFRHLPGGVFNKGFVRAHAQFIGVDAESMVTAYLEEEARQEAHAAATDPAARATSAGPAPARRRIWIAAAVVVLVLLLLAAGLTALGHGLLASHPRAERSDSRAVTPAAGGCA
ncbi:MAG TPA: helix-turn-helix domain-containing protein [Candidatus Sulfotelmatobacter sp.]|jgi:cytoskeletal protein RodZ|nr:helix-turn-helix domain-containing protein [Candidatus Sulfotelmatobacter sp.]